MKLFAYAYVNFFDNDPQLKTVLAEDVMGALHAIFCECCPVTDGFDSTDAAEAWSMFETPEDVVQYLLNGEIGITVPVSLEDLSDISIIAPINQPEDVEKPTSLFSSEPTAINTDKDLSVFADPTTTYAQMVYDLHYDGSDAYQQKLACARLAVALYMLQTNQFAHTLNISRQDFLEACKHLQDFASPNLSDSDYNHLSDLIDVGSDVYINSAGCVDFNALSQDYAKSGYKNVEVFLWKIWEAFPTCSSSVAAAAFCILLACPVFYDFLRNNKYLDAVQTFKDMCKQLHISSDL